MSIEKNKAVVRGYTENVWNGRRPDLIAEYMAEDCAQHDAPGLVDRESIQNFAAMAQNSVPDMRVSIEAEIGEGDLVVLRETVSGTPQGEFMGMPTNGERFSVPAVFVFRVIDGKIADMWGMSDGMRTLQQLGVIQVPEIA